MTLETRVDTSGNVSLSTTACPLCGEPIPHQNSLADHLHADHEAADVGEDPMAPSDGSLGEGSA